MLNPFRVISKGGRLPGLQTFNTFGVEEMVVVISLNNFMMDELHKQRNYRWFLINKFIEAYI